MKLIRSRLCSCRITCVLLSLSCYNRMASRVLLATLAVPIPVSLSNTEKYMELDENARDKAKRLSNLLSLQSIPTRKSLITDLVCIPTTPPPPPQRNWTLIVKVVNVLKRKQTSIISRELIHAYCRLYQVRSSNPSPNPTPIPALNKGLLLKHTSIFLALVYVNFIERKKVLIKGFWEWKFNNILTVLLHKVSGKGIGSVLGISKGMTCGYRRIPKVTAPVTIGISSPEGPQLLGSSYFWVVVTFGQLKYVSNPFQETHWMR